MSKAKITVLVLVTLFVRSMLAFSRTDDHQSRFAERYRSHDIVLDQDAARARCVSDGHGPRRIGCGAARRPPEPARGPVHSRHIERRFAYGGARHHRRPDLSRVVYDPGPCLYRRNRHRRHRGRHGLETGRTVARAAPARGRWPEFSVFRALDAHDEHLDGRRSPQGDALDLRRSVHV